MTEVKQGWLSRAVMIGLLHVFIAATSAAQTSAIGHGSVTIGGTARVSGFHAIGSDDTAFILDLNPRLGYFVTDRLSLQANLVYYRFTNDLNHNTSWGAGPGATYYFGGMEGPLYPFVSARTLFRWSKSPGADWLDTDYLAGIGMVAMVSDHVGVVGESFFQFGRSTVTSLGQQASSSVVEYGLRFGILGFVF